MGAVLAISVWRATRRRRVVRRAAPASIAEQVRFVLPANVWARRSLAVVLREARSSLAVSRLVVPPEELHSPEARLKTLATWPVEVRAAPRLVVLRLVVLRLVVPRLVAVRWLVERSPTPAPVSMADCRMRRAFSRCQSSLHGFT